MNLVAPSRAGYQSYLLRLWKDAAHNIWHASLQCTATAQVYHFASVEAMFAFLVARSVDTAPADARPTQGTADADE
jgi:hypothetical protein